ncbi:MAG: polyprenol monophosphomannose synthase [bacterium]|nr:polyprenol monophosphomannose synthase [bacterium]
MSIPTISLVVPTYNERENLPLLLDKIFAALHKYNISGEVVVVDDNSPDGTADLAEELGKTYPVRVVRREGKLGLSSAVIAGWNAALGELVGVIDADLSHDPNILPDMVYSITHGGADVALGSRYIPGGGVSNWPWYRRITSLVAVLMGRLIAPVNDVTSGYMVFRREIIRDVELDPIGFKINLEVLIKAHYKTVTEVPFIFVDRYAGKSKFNGGEIKAYLIHLSRLFAYWIRVRPQRQRIKYTKCPLPAEQDS